MSREIDEAILKSLDDKFTRYQIIKALEEVPLGYVTERDHDLLENFAIRAQAHFATLDPEWVPPFD